MPDYIQDPNNSKKQIPGPKPDNAYDRIGVPSQFSMSKMPHYVVIGTLTGDVGFFLEDSASFSELHTSRENTHYMLTSSGDYKIFGNLSGGTKLNIHPTAWSGSAGDVVTYVYKGGLDGMGR